jgi:hypothetical protein
LWYALRELDGNFVRNGKVADQIIVQFHNPSIRDFTQRYLTDNHEDVMAVVGSAVFFEQIMWLSHFEIPNERGMSFRPLLSQHLSVVVEAIRKTIHNRSCSLTYGTEQRDDQWIFIKTVKPVSLEKRIVEVAESTHGLGTDTVERLIRSLLSKVLRRIDLGEADKDELIDLIEALDACGDKLQPIADKLAEHTKPSVLDDLYRIRDFETLTRLQEARSELITQSDLDTARKLFNENYQEEVEEHLTGPDDDDPDQIRGWADRLETVGQSLNVDVNSDLENLRERAREIEDLPSPPDEERRVTPVPSGEEGTSEEISSLFSSLNL